MHVTDSSEKQIAEINKYPPTAINHSGEFAPNINPSAKAVATKATHSVSVIL